METAQDIVARIIEELDSVDEIDCPKHGKQKSSNGQCWACIRESIEKEKAEAAKQAALTARAALFSKSGIPRRFMHASFDNYCVDKTIKQQQRAYAIARHYAENYDDSMDIGRSIIMTGAVGTGKTHLAVAIAQSALARGKSVCFTSVQKLIRSITDTYSRDAEQREKDVFSAYRAVYLLILDEAGLQRGTENERNIITEVISDRYNDQKPTIITSNLPLERLKDYLTERAVDRLLHGGVLLEMTWDSYRRRGLL